jgi:chromosomal replication initiation ATPase DnaA
MTIWDRVLAAIQPTVPDEDFRRWFSGTAYASDSGVQITVWVPSEAIRRHLTTHYHDVVERALAAIGRDDTIVRFVVGGVDDDEEDD